MKYVSHMLVGGTVVILLIWWTLRACTDETALRSALPADKSSFHVQEPAQLHEFEEAAPVGADPASIKGPAKVQRETEGKVESSEGESDIEAVLRIAFNGDLADAVRVRSRETELSQLFAEVDLGEKAVLEEVRCGATICRGTIKIGNARNEREVFSRTFLSREFAMAIQDAVTVPTREPLPGGGIRATFYTHPNETVSVLEGVRGSSEE